MKKVLLIIQGLIFLSALYGKEISISSQGNSPMVLYALKKMEATVQNFGYTLAYKQDLTADIVIILQTGVTTEKIYSQNMNLTLAAEGYRITHNGKQIILDCADEKGAMYGILDLSEQLKYNKCSLRLITDKRVDPRFTFRGIKFNLPYMAYRSSISLTQQVAVICDLKFWEEFLDMMALNRYNVISLWSMHPFHYMIRAKNFPEACPFDDVEMRAWKEFWTQLFKMAHERGIETYLINWNTFVSPGFASAHNVALYSVGPSHAGTGDTSKIVEQYTRETVTQVINEYPDLDGLGITIGERMGGLTPEERRSWLDRTIFAGMKAADRKIKFIYRAPLSANVGSGGSTTEENDLKSRQHIEQLDVTQAFVEFKFNWSHGHSSPRLFMVHGGKLTDKYRNPIPEKYKYIWTMRNEDFYVLRWGSSEFIRDFIQNNGQEYVGGCFIGSEIFTPAMDYTSLPGLHKTWNYHFQRQWLWYSMWGRLLYDAKTGRQRY